MQLHYEHAVGSVLLPLAPEEVLVPGEVVLYRQRAHWAAMTEAIAETAGVLLLLTLVVTGTPPALGLVVASAIMMSVLLVTRWFTKRDWGWSDYLIIGIVALIAVEITPEVDTVIVVIAIVFVGRMLLAMVRWAFYEDRFVTDRRIIETSGFFGSRISSISLARVTDLTLYRSVPGEFFDYGELRVETPGQDQALDRIRYVRYPHNFHEAIARQATKPI
ncbi:MAG: PH domain-containing protein [Acidobacteria bacterium]|nr:PH domain-containing protein [Acidobacteriota bacterium]